MKIELDFETICALLLAVVLSLAALCMSRASDHADEITKLKIERGILLK